MKWRGLRALALGLELALVLLPGQAAAAVSTLKLEFPVRVAQEDMPLALPDVSPPDPTAAPVPAAVVGETAPYETQAPGRKEARPPDSPFVRARDSELVFATETEIPEPAVSCRWEMAGPLTWTMREDGLVEPGAEAPIALVVENLGDTPLWVRVFDATSEEAAPIYRTLGYEPPVQWEDGILLEPCSSHQISRAFTPVANVALEEKTTREPLPTLLVNVEWTYLARVDTEIYLDALTGGDEK